MAFENQWYGFTEAELNGYVEQDLPPDTLRAMERAIQTNPNLKNYLVNQIHLKRISTHPEFYAAIGAYGHSGLSGRRISTQNWVWISSLVVTLTLGIWGYEQYVRVVIPKEQAMHLVTTALQNAPNMDVYDAHESNAKLMSGLEAYRQRQFKMALPFFHQLMDPQDEISILYVAICELHLTNYKKARRYLRPILEKPDTPQEDLNILYWYMSLSLLGSEPTRQQVQEAKFLLEKIPPTDLYFKYAQEILIKLP